MDQTITTAFAPLIGLPCWGVSRGHGSILSFEFGSPHLSVREPIVSTSPSAKVRQRLAQRRVTPVGAWNLFVFCCHWRLVASGETLAEDADTHERIDAAARTVDGQKLTSFTLDAASHSTSFAFDLGATLRTWPYAVDDDADEQWSLYQPDGCVLTYRADGHCCLGPRNEKPGEETWHPVARGVLVP